MINPQACAPFDDARISMHLFHPRAEHGYPPASPDCQEILIPVAEKVVVGARYYMAHRQGGNLLFFHGNGEIVADYDDLGPYYNQLGINFMPVDYRGYGRSTGRPSVSALLCDSQKVFEYCRDWLTTHGFPGPLVVMGRSLGSASAISIVDRFASQVAGLIIESGFADTLGLMRVLGIEPATLGIDEDLCFAHQQKIAAYTNPLLVIHATLDHIIPFEDGQALFAASRSPQKRFLEIPNANHNNLLAVGGQAYFEAIRALVAVSGQTGAA
jgi:alpha-beta hydrolase superfamily lysophospholipase